MVAIYPIALPPARIADGKDDADARAMDGPNASDVLTWTPFDGNRVDRRRLRTVDRGTCIAIVDRENVLLDRSVPIE